MLEEVQSDQALAQEQPIEIEVTLAEFDERVELKKSIDRLLENPDYQKVIGKFFLVDDRDRLVGLLCSRNVAAIKEKDIIVNKIQAKGYLEQWIESTCQALNGIDDPRNREALLQALEEEAKNNE